MAEIEFKQPQEKDQPVPAKRAEAPPPERVGPKMRRVIIRTGENQETGPAKCPDPNCLDGGKWLVLPRNEAIEIDERVCKRLETRFVIDTVSVLDENQNPVMEHGRPKVIVKKLRRFPIDYLD